MPRLGEAECERGITLSPLAGQIEIDGEIERQRRRESREATDQIISTLAEGRWAIADVRAEDLSLTLQLLPLAIYDKKSRRRLSGIFPHQTIIDIFNDPNLARYRAKYGHIIGYLSQLDSFPRSDFQSRDILAGLIGVVPIHREHGFRCLTGFCKGSLPAFSFAFLLGAADLLGPDFSAITFIHKAIRAGIPFGEILSRLFCAAMSDPANTWVWKIVSKNIDQIVTDYPMLRVICDLYQSPSMTSANMGIQILSLLSGRFREELPDIIPSDDFVAVTKWITSLFGRFLSSPCRRLLPSIHLFQVLWTYCVK
jgi:hypothetical protein